MKKTDKTTSSAYQVLDIMPSALPDCIDMKAAFHSKLLLLIDLHIVYEALQIVISSSRHLLSVFFSEMNHILVNFSFDTSEEALSLAKEGRRMGGVAEGICLAGIGRKREGHNCIIVQNYPVSTIFLEVPIHEEIGCAILKKMKCELQEHSRTNQEHSRTLKNTIAFRENISNLYNALGEGIWAAKRCQMGCLNLYPSTCIYTTRAALNK
ncbi:hypothetical protein LXL04_022769 [Taraxacum kok-saghyz]